MLLARFPKLNANKVYATGFSSGGGMTYMLACYRGSRYRGFSVAAKTLGGDSARGDYDQDAYLEIDPDSFVATCGKNERNPGHATGITAPEVWGAGLEEVRINEAPSARQPGLTSVFRAKPVALFVGDFDFSGNEDVPTWAIPAFQARTIGEINDTGDFIRDKNNLNGLFVLQNPFLDIAADGATTQRRTFTLAADGGRPSAAFRRFFVQGSLDPRTDLPVCQYHMPCPTPRSAAPVTIS